MNRKYERWQESPLRQETPCELQVFELSNGNLLLNLTFWRVATTEDMIEKKRYLLINDVREWLKRNE